MFRVVIAAASLAFLGACATRYEGSGVQATRIDEHTVKVTADGNLFTDMGLLEEYVLLRTAEETMAAGYTHFAIVSTTDRSEVFTHISPGRATTNTTGHGTVLATGNSATIHGSSTSTTTYEPPRVSSYSKPSVEIIIRMFKENKKYKIGDLIAEACRRDLIDDQNCRSRIWDAASIVEYLGPKHKTE